MKDITKVFRPHVFFRQAGVVEYCLIRGEKFSVGLNTDDELRDCINDCSKVNLGFGHLVESALQCALSALAVVDVRHQRVPANNSAFGIPPRMPWYQAATIGAIKSTAPMLRTNRLTGLDCAR